MAARENIVGPPTSLPSAPGYGMSGPEDFAASGFGRGLSQLGGALHRDQVQSMQIERQRSAEAANTQAAIDYAALVRGGEDLIRTKREEALPDATGHVTTVENEFKARGEAFLAAIPDQRVRDRWSARIAEWQGNSLSNEDGWARGRRVVAIKANVLEAGDGWDEMQLGAPDLERFAQSLEAGATVIDGLNAPPHIRDELVKDWGRNRALGLAAGMRRNDAAGLQALILGGALDPYLTADDKEKLLGQADAGVRVIQAEQARALAVQRTEGREQINLFQKRLADQDPSIDDDDIEAMGKLAAELGLGAEVYDLGKARLQVQVDREYRTASEIEIGQAVDQLNAKIAKAGDKASLDDVVRRDRMIEIQSKRRTQVASDPLGAYSAAGGTVAPVVSGDRSSIQRRVVAARSARDQFGRYAFFRPGEVSGLQEQLASGPDGRAQVAGMLAEIAAVDGEAGLRAATQLAPNDRTLRHALRLSPGARAIVLRGSSAKSVVPPSLIGPEGSKMSADAAVDQWFAANVAPGMVQMPGEFVADIRDSVKAAYADHRRRAGATGEDEFDTAAVQAATNLVLGGSGGRGGVTRWTRGPRAADGKGAVVVLPMDMSAREFERRLLSMPRQGGSWPARSVNGIPTWGDGTSASAITVGDILSKFTPVKIRGSTYQFRNGDQVLQRRGGGPWELDIARITPTAPAPPAKPVSHSGSQATAQPAVRQLPMPKTRGATWGVPPDRQ